MKTCPKCGEFVAFGYHCLSSRDICEWSEDMQMEDYHFLLAERDRLKAIVDQLPKTADGVRVAPVHGVHVYQISNTGHIQESRGWNQGRPTFRYLSAGEVKITTKDPSLCYSTREAAEAAKEKDNGKAKP